mmetsp:Transcript_130/g.246  ORF Transcript_130/g.246 Transcript_130/m.246 type:complete len:181 (+) Transcript_130:92-634(+)
MDVIQPYLSHFRSINKKSLGCSTTSLVDNNTSNPQTKHSQYRHILGDSLVLLHPRRQLLISMCLSALTFPTSCNSKAISLGKGSPLSRFFTKILTINMLHKTLVHCTPVTSTTCIEELGRIRVVVHNICIAILWHIKRVIVQHNRATLCIGKQIHKIQERVPSIMRSINGKKIARFVELE